MFALGICNTPMGCTLAAGFAPQAAVVSPLITGDRGSSLVIMGTIGVPDIRPILALQGSRGW